MGWKPEEKKKHSREYYLRNKERILAQVKEYSLNNKEKMDKYRKEYREIHKEELKEYAKKYRKENPELKAIQTRKYYEKHFKKTMVYSAMRRALALGIPFDITEEDIIVPEKCPIFGVTLTLGRGGSCRNSPSLDRIIPKLGYIRGNIQVISQKANNMKNDASEEELKTFANWILKNYGESTSN